MKTPSDKGYADKRNGGYTPALWLIELTNQIRICESDINNILSSDTISLAAQLRAYDLLDAVASYSPLHEQMDILANQLAPDNSEAIFHNFDSAVDAFCNIVCSNSVELEVSFNRSNLQEAASSYLRPWIAQLHKMEDRANQAMLLYNAADYAHKCQQNGSFFKKWSSLRAVRKLAGFRLERKRTGNYVTKTYELMLDAQKELMAAQQQMYSHNVGYKCEQMLYTKISSALKGTDPA